MQLTESARQKVSESVRKRWQDPEYRARQEAKREQAKQKASETMKDNWADPEFREKTIAAHNTPEVRERMGAGKSEFMKERWQDPEYRASESKRRSEFAKTRQGTKHPRYKDGRSKTAEYRAFHNAQQRCINSKHPGWLDYGARGIKFLFTSFEEFLAVMGTRPSPKHSIERINNGGNYEAGNVCWATGKEQVANRRKHTAIQNYTDAELLAEVERRGLKLPEPFVPEYGLEVAC